MATIRKATLDDIDRIYRIIAAAFGPYCIAKLLEDRFGVVDGKSWVEHKAGGVVESFRRRIEDVFVAEDGGQVVGFASLSCSGDTGAVGNNAVHPDSQGRGIGTRLIRTVLDELTARGVKHFRVSTMLHDAPARRVYEKLGFVEEKRVVQFAKRAGEGVDRETVDATDTDAQERLARQGYAEMARSVHYRMTR